MIVLDTDVLTIVQRADSDDYARLVNRLQAAGPQPVYATIVSFEEQLRGWLAYIARAKTLERQIAAYARLRGLLEDFQTRPVLDFDDAAAREYRQLTKAKVRIGTLDLKIAAITLAHGATLLSQNLADYRRIRGLRVEDWTAAARP
jgi:tRNA(fMet)-specific endonuclease VapC